MQRVKSKVKSKTNSTSVQIMLMFWCIILIVNYGKFPKFQFLVVFVFLLFMLLFLKINGEMAHNVDPDQTTP